MVNGDRMVSAIDPTKPADGVPAKKADLRANLSAAKREIEVLQEVKKQNGDPYDMEFAPLTKPRLMGYVEAMTQLTITEGGSVTWSVQDANVAKLTLTQHVVNLFFTDVPAPNQAVSIALFVVQDAVGNHTLTWPLSVKWPNGMAQEVSMSPKATDIYAFVTLDGGVTWYGFVGGQRF
jgi:hypothetical protein